MVKNLLALIGFFSICLFAADADLELELKNESGRKLFVKDAEESYSYLPEGYTIPEAEIESGASFHHDITILLERYFDNRIRRGELNKITFGVEGDDTGDFSISWDKYTMQMSCPKGYRVKQSKDKTKFSFTLLPD